MRILLTLSAIALVVMLPLKEPDQAGDGTNWKIGRVYNRLVCNACHRQDGGHVVSPYERTKADWQAYFESDKHATGKKANQSARYYASIAYRKSIMDKNKAAAKFVKMPDGKMAAHVIAFYVRGAKDSDTPARCQ